MASIDYTERIPNNVGLGEDRRLQRALEEWQPKFIAWWQDVGPHGFQATEVYLRTAVSVDPQGWAQFGYVRMPEYRWGIFLAEPEPARVIPFGDHKGQPVWQDVPGEYRGVLRRLIVTQGDTEPASVEQQRHLGRTCPSLYDLRNLFQVNVEEGRHLWAMVYLLDAYFGRDGREESEALLERRSGDPDKPRILGAFNEKTLDWLSYLMFTYFTDRDGKYQLASLAESGFDPLARTCRFMLTEEAHHMFVGETGVGRVVQRTCELMRDGRTDDVRKHGAIDLPTLQKYLNFHYSVSLDLFGSEISTNAANFYAMSLKGRFEETKKNDDHRLQHATYPVTQLDGETLRVREHPALPSLNERLRDDYIADCQRGLDRWNRIIREHGIDFELTLAHRAFHRKIGTFADVRVSPEGRLLTEAEWGVKKREWLPSPEDEAYVQSLMQPVTERGQLPTGSPRPRVASTASRSTSNTSGSPEPARRGAMPRVIAPREFGKPLGMYSHGMAAPAGEIVVVAGQVGARRAGEVAGPDVESQTKQAFENVRAVVEAAGCSMKDVVRLQTFLTSADDIGGFMKARQEVFATYFGDGVYPPNTLLVVSRLVRPELRVEIEAMAVRARAVTRRPPVARRRARR